MVSGDVFLSRKIKEEGRVISVLSDGLGSGVKASVLANLTATMALRYTSAFVDVRQSAGIIMDTLPICEVRKISYSTFTIVDLDEDGRTRVIEHGNPPLVLLRGRAPVALERASLTLGELEGPRDSLQRIRHPARRPHRLFIPTASPSPAWAARGCRWAGARTGSSASCNGKSPRNPEISVARTGPSTGG